MIEIDELAARTYEIRLSAKITASDLEKIESILAPFVADEGSVDVLLDMRAMQETTWSGLLEDATLEARLFQQLEKFGRLALVSEHDSLDFVASAANNLMPSGQFKRFKPSDIAKARDYVTAAI